MKLISREDWRGTGARVVRLFGGARRRTADAFPVYVKRAAGRGRVLDVEAFVRTLVTEVVADIAEQHMDDMDTLAEGLVDPKVERLVSERLVERLVADHRTRIALGPDQARRVAGLLLGAAGPALKAVSA